MLSVGVMAEGGKVRISGYVRDGEDYPLELVAVTTGGHGGAVTNEKGFYSVDVQAGDSVRLVFSCLGYGKVERIIPEVMGDLRVNVRMNYISFALGEITATATRRQISAMETLDADKIRFLADPSGGSIESLVVTFAGVSSGNELSSQYSVRGGSYDENMVYVNGVEVFRPLLIRSGQQEGLTFTNPDLTESVRFAAGGFEARYGDKMSSVLDITYKRPSNTEGSVTGGLMGGNAYVGSGAGKWTQITGVRYKTARSLLATMDTEAEYDPEFLDLQSYITYRPSRKWEIGILGYLSRNTYRFRPFSRETSFGTPEKPQNFFVYFDGMEQDRFETLSGAFSVKCYANEQMELGLQGSAFHTREEENYDILSEYWIGKNGTVNQDEEGITSARTVGGFLEHARNKLHATILNLTHSGSFRLRGNTVQWGASIQGERIRDRLREWERRDSAGYSLPHTGEGVNVFSSLYADETMSSLRLWGYVQDVAKFRTPQGLFTFIGGVRGSYWDYNREFIVSPRASIGFIPNFDQDITLRLAGGVYYQSPFYKELRKVVRDSEGNETVALNASLRSQRSMQLIVGGDYSFKVSGRNFKVTAEAYYKKLDRLVPYTIDNVKIRYYGENCGAGRVWGLDTKLFGEFVPGVDSWLSFSLMDARQTIRRTQETGTTTVRTVPLPNSQGYNISLYFHDYFPRYDRLSVTLKGMLSGGLPVTIPHKGYEDGYFRLPPYRRIDLGFSYRLSGAGVSSERTSFFGLRNIWLALDVFNLFGINNTNSYYWLTDVYGQQYAVPNYLTGRQLNVRLMVDF
ncbi:MAG: TonB-dependent receptor [Tannerellaceae bacterium]|nr:TonB-dependent receptor [Tannerellaceae bacterium]